MAGKVEVKVKDGGHSIVIKETELRGDKSIICDETDDIKNLRRAGLITTKPYQGVEVKKTVVEPVVNVPVKVEPPQNELPVVEEDKGDGIEGGGKSNNNKPNTKRHNPNWRTLKT